MLTAIDVCFGRGGQVVLDGVSITVGPRSRTGLVGPNGVGKTTLLRILAGLEQPDSGRVERAPAAITVGYLPQEAGPLSGEGLAEYLCRRTGVQAAERRLDEAVEAMAVAADDGAIAEHAAALDAFLSLGGADFSARMGAVLADVGLSADRVDVPLAELSGGQQARAALAAVLLARFDIFLLDEPTNDLDFAGLDRLAEFLDGLSGGVVVVSHDRAFLDQTVDRIVEIEEGTRRSAEYAGGWTAWQEQRDVARSQASAAFEGYATERARLVTRERTQREWAVAGTTKAKKKPKDKDKYIKGFTENRTEKLAGKVRITEKAIARLDREAVEKPFEPWQLRLSFAGGGRSGDVVARLEGAVVRRGAFTLGPVDLQIGWRERLAVVGRNGSGKSTLLAALLGEATLAAGTRTLGPGVVVGTMDQRRSAYGGRGPLLETFTSETGLEGSEARTLLAKFGLVAEHVRRAAGELSPGERSRAVLATLMARGVNLLVLDEPTNHLDVPAIEQLEQALGAFDATLVLVSHDRRLLEAVEMTRTIVVEDGVVL